MVTLSLGKKKKEEEEQEQRSGGVQLTLEPRKTYTYTDNTGRELSQQDIVREDLRRREELEAYDRALNEEISRISQQSDWRSNYLSQKESGLNAISERDSAPEGEAYLRQKRAQDYAASSPLYQYENTYNVKQEKQTGVKGRKANAQKGNHAYTNDLPDRETLYDVQQRENEWRADRDNLIDRFAADMQAVTDVYNRTNMPGYQQTQDDLDALKRWEDTYLEVERRGGIENLAMLEEHDKNRDYKYRAMRNGVDIEGMTLPQKAEYVIGDMFASAGLQSGAAGVGVYQGMTNKAAEMAEEGYDEGLKMVVNHYLGALANDPNGEGTQSMRESIATTARTLGGDDYANRILAYIDNHVQQVRANTDRPDFSDYYVGLDLSSVGRYADTAWRNLHQIAGSQDVYDTMFRLQDKANEYMQHGKDIMQSETGDRIMEAGVSAIQSAADALPAAALGLTGPLAMVPFGVRAYGGGVAEASRAVMSRGETIGKDMARNINRSAGISAAIEVGTEMLWGLVGARADIMGGGALDDAVTKRLTSALERMSTTERGSKILSYLGEKVLGGVFEGVEEVLADAANWLLDTAGMYGEDRGTFEEMLNEAGTSFTTGVLAGWMGEVSRVATKPMGNSMAGRGIRQEVGELSSMLEAARASDSRLGETLADIASKRGIDLGAEMTSEQLAEQLTNADIGKLYSVYEETLDNEGVEDIRRALHRMENGKELTERDVNRIARNEEALQYLEDVTGEEIDRANVTASTIEAIEGLASRQEASQEARAEYDAQKEKNRQDVLWARAGREEAERFVPGVDARQNTIQTLEALDRMGVKGEAAKIIADAFIPGQNALEYAGDAMRFYTQGKNGREMDASSIGTLAMNITPGQAIAAYNAGRMEMIGDEYNESETERTEEGSVRVRGGVQGNDGQGAGESAGGVASQARSLETREEIAGFRGGKKVSGVRSGPVSTKDLGLKGGTGKKNIQIIQESNSKDFKEAKNIVESQGLKFVGFVGGAMEFETISRKGNKLVTQARGYYDPETGTVYVRMDHQVFTGAQLAKHEAMHDKIRKGEVDLAAARDLMREKLGTDKFVQALDAYSALYEGTDMSREEIFEEMICDAAGNMNEFMYQGHMEDAMKNLSAMKAAREAGKEAKGEGEARESEGKRSIDWDYAGAVKEWYDLGMPANNRFVLGSTGDVFQGLGAIESDIYIQGDKIKTILNDHPEMTIREIQRIPEILENPTLVLKSSGQSLGEGRQNTRLVVFGEVKGTDGSPVLVVLDLRPVEKNMVIDYMQKVSSAYGKNTNPADFVRKSDAVYTSGKEKTAKLLRTLGLQLRPSELLDSGFIGSISYNGQNVNISGTPFSEIYKENEDLGDSGEYKSEAGGKFSRETDTEVLKKLNSGPTMKVYRSMQLIDGKLYPPMAAKVKGEMVEPAQFGTWYVSDERQDAINKVDKRGVGWFTLDKANKDTIEAAYNPYWHTSDLMINDQFSSAYKRGNLVTVECEIPESELTSGYKAEYAKDPVGKTDWHKGPVAGKLSKTGTPRTVYLSRWVKVNRIVSDAEVAKNIAKYLEGTGISVPVNTVTPSLRSELEKIGVPIGRVSGNVNESDKARLNSSLNEEQGKHSRELKSEQKRAAGEKLTEAQFYSLYSAHKIYAEAGDVEARIRGIKEEGFKGAGGQYGTNLMPTQLSVNIDKDGKRTPGNASVARYGPRKGEYILLVPRSGAEITKNYDRVKPGYKPMFDYEIVQADYDFQPYYEMYSKAYDAAKQSVKLSRDLGNSELLESQQQLKKDLAHWMNLAKNRAEQRDRWRRETTLTKGRQVRMDDAKRLAKTLLKEHSSKADADALAKKVKDLSEFCLNFKEFDDAFLEEARMKSYEIAHMILEETEILNEQGGETFYKDFRDYLRNTKMFVPVGVQHDLTPDKWNDYRKSLMGTLNLSAADTKAMGIDVAYKELQDKFGEWLFPDDIVNPADQVRQMLEVVETYRPVYEHINDYDMAEAVEWAANDILTRVVGEELRQTEPTYADKMEGKLKEQKEETKAALAARDEAEKRLEQYKARSQKALKRVRQNQEEKVAQLKQHYQEVAEKRKGDKELRELRQRLLKLGRRVNSMKVPRVAGVLRDQIIGELDFVATSITGRKLANLQALSDWYNEQKRDDPNFFQDKQIEKDLERLGKKHIKDLSREEISDLIRVLQNFENEWSLKKDGKFIDSSVITDRFVSSLYATNDILATKGRRSKNETARWLSNFFIDNQLSSDRAMKRLTGYRDNDPLRVLMKEVEKGHTKKIDFTIKANKMFAEWLDDDDFAKQISGKKARPIKVVGTPGAGKMTKTIEITPGHAIGLYLSSMNDDNMRHIMQGGIRVPDISIYRKGNVKLAYEKGELLKFTKEAIREVEAQLTDKEKAFANKVYEYFNRVAPEAINAVSEQLLGYSKATVKKYYPIKVLQSFLRRDFGDIAEGGTPQSLGFLNERVDSAKNPVVLADVVDVLRQSIDQNGTYVGLAIPIRNFELLYNTNAKAEDGMLVSVKEALGSQWGHYATDYIDKVIMDVQGKKQKAKEIEKPLNKARGNQAKAALYINAGTGIKQAASGPIAAATLGAKAVRKAFLNPASLARKVDPKLISRYTPLYEYRALGYSTPELGDITNKKADLPKALKWIEAIDLWTVRRIWRAAEYYVLENNKDLKPYSHEFYEAVKDKWEQTVHETQPNYTPMQRSQSLRSEGIERSFHLFKTQPYQNFNIIYDAVGEFRAKRQQMLENTSEDTIARYNDSKVNLARAIGSQIVSSFVFALMQFVVDMARGKRKKYKDDDDEMTLLSWLKGMGLNILSNGAGMLPLGGLMLEGIESGTDMVLKALGKEAFFEQRYWGVSEPLIDAVNESGNFVGNLLSKVAAFGSGKVGTETFIRNMTDSFGELAALAGIPVSNAIRTMQSLARVTMEGGAATGLLFDGNKLEAEFYSLRMTTDPAKYPGDYYNLLYKAYKKDRSSYEAIYQKMIEDGSGVFTEEKIKENIERRMKEDQGVNSVDDLESRWMTPEQERLIAEYGPYIGGYEALNLTTSPAKNSGDYFDLLYDAYSSGDEDYGKLYRMLIDDTTEKEDDNGNMVKVFTDASIRTSMENHMKKDQGVNSVDDLSQRYMNETEQAIYDKGINDISKTKIWLQATDAQQQKLFDTLYNIAIGNSEGQKATEKIKGGASVGLDQTEYLLYTLALDMADKPNKSGNMGTYTNEEVEEAIRMLTGLSDQERAYLWDAAGKNAKTNPWKR